MGTRFTKADRDAAWSGGGSEMWGGKGGGYHGKDSYGGESGYGGKDTYGMKGGKDPYGKGGYGSKDAYGKGS